MIPQDSHDTPPQRHAKIRRAKWFLRFVPRKARLHHVPLLGRFAGLARQRSYLWSFRPTEVRRAFYLGSILALLPVMGVQLPIALALTLLLRANFMIAGGLQFITNPFTAAPVYYSTYYIGKRVTGWIRSFHETLPGDTTPLPAEIDDALSVDLSLAEIQPGELNWAAGFGFTVSSLVIGGIICGTMLGGVLDLIFTRRQPIRNSAKNSRTPPRPSNHISQ